MTKWQSFRKRVKESAVGARVAAKKREAMSSDAAKEFSEGAK